MESLAALLRQSIDAYRRMRDLAASLAAELGSAAPENLLARAGELDALLREAGDVDAPLAALGVGVPEALLPLAQERLELLREVGEGNRQLTAKLQAMLAVARSDLADLRQGRTAISGYHSGVMPAGRRIDSC